MRNIQVQSLPMTKDVPLSSQLITRDPAVPDMEPGNACFLKDGEKSSIEIDVNSVPMLH